MVELDSIEQLDLARYVRPGDTVVVGQACATPAALCRRLVQQRESFTRSRIFLGTDITGLFRPEHADHLDFLGFGAMPGSRALAAAGLLDVLPVHYSALEPLVDTGHLACDVVLLQVGPAGPDGRYSPGPACDYVMAAVRRARTVIAQVNRTSPATCCDRAYTAGDFDCIVHVDEPCAQMAPAPPSEVDARIAQHVVEHVPDGATLQVGIGGISEAVLAGLRHHRRLGIHSGMLGDGIVDLVDCGAITNECKAVDAGASVAGVLIGSRRILDFADRNDGVLLRPASRTHDLATLARLPNFVSVNSALEVDLTGQVNAEELDGLLVGAVGGQGDFVRGAAAAQGGRSIIALRSTGRAATVSRVVARLRGPVTTPRSDVDLVVTEWGAADLRGKSMRQRSGALVQIAHPMHREALGRAASGMGLLH